MRFYGTESIDNLSQIFHQMALSPPSLSPAQLFQRALNESIGFIISTLQECRDIHGHTSSLCREARTQGFLQRVRNLHLQPPIAQNMASTTPGEQEQLHYRYSGVSHDSGIAFPESDIDENTFYEPDQNCSSIGKAGSLRVRDMALSKEKNVQFGKTHFGIHVVTTFEL